MGFSFKCNMAMGLLAGMLLAWTTSASAADPQAVDSRYIKEHFPDAYHQIYEEGKQAGKQEGTAALTEEEKSASKPEKTDLGKWWEKNSLTYNPLPEPWLFHVEGTLSYKHKTGNVDSNRYDGSASLMVRKLRLTNTLNYIIDKEKTEQAAQPGDPPSITDTDYRSFQEILRYDLLPRLYTETGYIYEEDKANYISDRDNYYAGLGYTLIDTPKHTLDLLAAGGYVKEKYPELVQTAMDMERSSTSAGYVRETYRWHITDRLTYKETFRIIQDATRSDVFNDDLADLYVIDRTYRYRWFLVNEIYIDIIDHLAFMVGCKIEYDSNPWPTVEKRDITIKSGIQFSF
jgi:putative salt-induced outer membrane protein YdiY